MSAEDDDLHLIVQCLALQPEHNIMIGILGKASMVPVKLLLKLILMRCLFCEIFVSYFQYSPMEELLLKSIKHTHVCAKFIRKLKLNDRLG